jgi:hypothetical protein
MEVDHRAATIEAFSLWISVVDNFGINSVEFGIEDDAEESQ